MGCGLSKARQSSHPQSSGLPREENARLSISEEEETAPKARVEEEEFDQKVLSSSKAADEAFSSSQSNQGLTLSPSLLSSRQSLAAASGSLGSKIGRSNVLPAGWSLGRGVLVREDNRTAHITNLACTILKVPVILIISREGGRNAVAVSKGLLELGERLWLPDFCNWLEVEDVAGQPITVEDTLEDERSRNCSWAKEQPGIRYLTACSLLSLEGERIGTMCAADLQPHPNAGASAPMLSNLANMAARELDAPAPSYASCEYVVHNTLIEPQLREKIDAYCWTTCLVDTRTKKWTMLFINRAFGNMTGIPPGCLEGLDFWDYFQPVKTSDKEPWESYQSELEGGLPFTLEPVLFQAQMATTSNNTRKAQMLRVEMREFNSETALTHEVEAPTHRGLWFAGFMPEARGGLDPSCLTTVARSSLDLSALGPSSPNDSPFPGLELGPVVGKGSFGYVCRGALGYLIVAVKIIEAEAIFKVDAEGTPLEVSLAQNLRHPNIVQMLDYATRLRKDKSPSQAGSTAGSRASRASTQTPQTGNDGASTPQSAFQSAALSVLGGDGTGTTVEAWLLLEYCDLGSLQDGMDRKWFGSASTATMPAVPNLVAIENTAYEIAAAMRYLHSHNILHGDLTAGNVLLASAATTPKDPRGFIAKVADFGLSREALTSKVETNSYGTVTHMPPELLNDGYLSKHADVYAFGVLLVEMYTGKRAFTGMRHPQIIHTIAVLKKHPELPANAPPHLVELAEACMQENPKDRPPFQQIMEILKPRLEQHPIQS